MASGADAALDGGLREVGGRLDIIGDESAGRTTGKFPLILQRFSALILIQCKWSLFTERK